MTIAQCSVYTNDLAFEDNFCGFGAANFVDDAYGDGIDAVTLAGCCDCSTNAPGERDRVFDGPAFGFCTSDGSFCAADVRASMISACFWRVMGNEN